MSKTNFKYRVRFAKADEARFIGHLDLQSLFQKAFKRASLPVAYSEGFNPHQILSFAVPLPLGTAGLNEIAEVYMTTQVAPETLLESLSRQMPNGIAIQQVCEIASTGRGAAALVSSATYHIILSDCALHFTRLESAVKEVLNSPEIMVRKKTKKGSGVVDIRSDILDLTSDANADKFTITATLSTGSARNLKPSLLMSHILDTLGIDAESIQISYERTTLILSEGIA